MNYAFFALLFSTALFAQESITSHRIDLKSGSLSYQAEVGMRRVSNRDQTVQGDIGYISYIKTDGDPERAITFAFNGGPGSSSIWLHLGAFGPRRVVTPEEGQSIVPPYKLVDNLETLLDLTDLVFIDPVGTGLSQAPSKGTENFFYETREDIHSIGEFIRNYLTENHRWNCPKYIAGESYGALRACGLAAHLQHYDGIYLNGLILVSPAIDFQTIVFDPDNPLPYLLFFPSYATTAWYHGRFMPELSIEEVAAKARLFAYEIYAPTLFRKSSLNGFQKDSLYENVAHFIGLPSQTVRRHQAKISDHLFFLEFFGDQNQILGRMDTRSVGDYIHLVDSEDPSCAEINGVFAGGFHKYLHEELGISRSYCLFSEEINRQWDYSKALPFGYPNFMNALRQAMVANPSLKIFAGCGYFDCATPFGATEYCLDQLNLPSSYEEKVQLEYYEGGHMYYVNPAARIKFKEDLIRFYKE